MILIRRSALVLGLSAASLLAFPSLASAVDAGAAQSLARQNKCFNCHAVDKKKEAPAWKDVAAKYKGKPDAEAKLVTHLTTGPKVKFDDGHQEDHPILKTKNQDDIKNLVAWILSL